MSLQWHSPDIEKVSDLKINNSHLSMASFMRLLLPELLDARTTKLIYLDCDLVVEANLEEMWKNEIGDHAVLAVPSFAAPYISSPFGVEDYDQMNLPPDVPNFNSGVMVLNLEAWREEQISQRILTYLRESESNKMEDQGGMNAVLVGRWQALDPKWNQMHNAYKLVRYDDDRLAAHGYKAEDLEQLRATLREVIQTPKIIHFTGASKPWNRQCYHPQQHRFAHYLRASGWFSKTQYARWQMSRCIWRVQRNSWRLARRAGLKRPPILRLDAEYVTKSSR